jgi:hypothetical protein
METIKKGEGSQAFEYAPMRTSPEERRRRRIARVAFGLVVVLFLGAIGTLVYINPAALYNPRALYASWGPWGQQGGESEEAQGSTAPQGSAANGAAELGTLTVRSEPEEAVVRLDGDSVGVTPLEAHRLPAGVYVLSVERPRFARFDTIAVVSAATPRTFAVTMRPRLPRPASAPPGAATAEATRPVPSASGQQASAGGAPAVETERSPDTPPAEADAASPDAPSRGTLRVATDPVGARVYLDGEAQGTAPLTVDRLAFGTYRVEVRAAGYVPSTAYVEIQAETPRHMVRMTLAAQDGGPPEEVAAEEAPEGRIRVLVKPWGSIFIDGALQVRNTDVWYEAALPPGQYTLMAIHPSIGEHVREVEVKDGVTRTVVIDLIRLFGEPPPSP